MQIVKKLTQNNYNQVAKLIQKSSLTTQCLNGVIKNQLKKFRQSYKIPAKLQSAQIHQKSVKYGFKPPLKGKQGEVCSCCNIRIQNQDIPICYPVQPNQKNISNNEQFKLTSGVALFFSFIKSLILFLLINSIIHGIFNVYSSYFLGNYCNSLATCRKTIWNITSISNKADQQNLIFTVDLLNLIFIIIGILFFTYNRRCLNKLRSLIERQSQDQSNYTILVSNIPLIQFPKKEQTNKNDFFYRKRLQTYFETIIKKWLNQKQQWNVNKDKAAKQLLQLIKNNNGQLRSEQIIKSISLCYNLSRLQVLHEIKQNLVEQYEEQIQQGTSLMNAQNNQKEYSGRFFSIPQRVNFMNDCQLILNGQFARDNSFLFNVTHFVGHAFISFQYSHYRDFIMEQFKRNQKAFFYNGNYLKIQEAAYPADVNWQNFRISVRKQNKKTLNSYFWLGIILLLSFVILLFLQYWKMVNSRSENGDIINPQKSYILTVVISVIIKMINSGLDELSYKLTSFQGRKSQTDFYYSLFKKSFFSKLINTIVLYFIVSFLLTNTQNKQFFMGNTSLIFQISSLIIIQSILKLLLSLINASQLWLRFKRWINYRKSQNEIDKKFQISLNKQFQLPQWSMTHRYTDYLVTLYAALFYSYLVPITLISICIIFFLQYWIDKINLLRKSSLKFHFNSTLSMKINTYFECSILALCLGNLIFSLFIQTLKNSLLNLIGLAIILLFILFILITPKKIEQIIFGQYEYNQKYIYDDCLYDGKFESTYWTQNPATFLVQEQKITGKKKPVNPALYRQSHIST